MPEANGPNGAPNSPTDKENDNKENPETPETVKDPEAVLAKNRDLLAANKKKSDRISELEKKLEAIENEELQKKGKLEELVEKTKIKADENEAKYTNTFLKFSEKALKAEFNSVASSLGCQSIDDAYALAKESLKTEVEIDEDFNVNQDQLKKIVEGMKEKKGWLFKSGTPDTKDKAPNANNQTPGPKKFKSQKELEEYAMSKGLL